MQSNGGRVGGECSLMVARGGGECSLMVAGWGVSAV